MRDHQHIELFRRTYAAFTTGDMDALAEVFAEDVGDYHVAVPSAWATIRSACSLVHIGPHATGAFAQVAGVILHKQARVQNPNKDEVLR